jgi:O-antigen/teichoic acid export membrane protein
MAIPIVFKLIPDFKPILDKTCMKNIREVWSFSLYALLANVSVLLVLKIDPIIVQGFLSLSMVAVYAIAAKIAEQLLLFNKQLSNALMPLISQSKGKGDEETIRKVLLDGSKYLLVIAFPMLGLVFVYAPDLVVLWVGKELAAAAPLLRILILAVLMSTLILNAANVLGMTGRHRLVAMALTSSALLNLGLSLVLIQTWGLTGVAWATFVGIVLCELMILLPIACRSLNIHIMQFVHKSVLPGLISCSIPLGLAAWITPPASLTELVLYCVTFGLLSLSLYACFGLNARERQFVHQLKNRISGEKTQCAPSTAS